MKIDFEGWVASVKELQLEIEETIKKRQEKNRTLISDGVVNYSEYYKAPIRIVWLLKEAYCDGNNGGGEWSIVKDLNEFRAVGLKYDSPKTWNPIAYVTYGLLNGFLRYREMPKLKSNPEILLSLRKIAFVNVQKLPAKKQTNLSELRRQVPQEELNLVAQQIKVYDPHIVIAGGTLSLIKTQVGLTKDHELPHNHFQKNGTLYLNMHHPAQFKITEEQYVDKICLRVQQFQVHFQTDRVIESI